LSLAFFVFFYFILLWIRRITGETRSICANNFVDDAFGPDEVLFHRTRIRVKVRVRVRLTLRLMLRLTLRLLTLRLTLRLTLT
jgi:hypothetical protein